MKTFEELFDIDGNYKIDPNYVEILKLNKLLNKAGIPHTCRRFMDGWQVCYPSASERVCDAIEHNSSYGSSNDLLELMGLLSYEESRFDSVVGNLTAREIFHRIRNHYEKNCEKINEIISTSN